MSACSGHEPQGLLLAAAADQHRDVAGTGGGFSLASRDSMRGSAARQVVQPLARRPELVAVLVVVLLEPARADAEDQPAVADVVDGAGHVGQQLGVAVAVAGDERADLDPAGLLGPGAEHRPALEVLAVGLAVERVEVVPVEDDVDAEVFGLADGAADRRVVGVLGCSCSPMRMGCEVTTSR